MGLRNVQSSHVLQNSLQSGHQGPPVADPDAGNFRPSSWDNTVSPLFTEESLNRGNSAEVCGTGLLCFGHNHAWDMHPGALHAIL